MAPRYSHSGFHFETFHDLRVTPTIPTTPSPSVIIMAQASSLCGVINVLGSRDNTLAIARPLRRIQAEVYRVALSSLHSALTFTFSQHPIAASDASMLPLTASFLQARSVTSAAATPDSRVVFLLGDICRYTA
ncbi:hypothetical protein F4604DRAFT_1921794 [Suillus subluteus]|nr:hypothetical protein F4604DRAFT_1921794 [Suillus subluteus]